MTPTHKFNQPCDVSGNYIYDSSSYALPNNFTASWASDTLVIQNVATLSFNVSLGFTISIGDYIYIQNPNNSYDFGYFYVTNVTNLGTYIKYSVTCNNYGSINSFVEKQGYSICIITGYQETTYSECLTSILIEVAYLASFAERALAGSTEFGPAGCSGGHGCNNAKFELLANGVPVGIFNLNNVGGGQDDQNYPPWVPSNYDGYSRYNSLTISPLEAQAIANANPGSSIITFGFIGAPGYPNPHSGEAFVKISQNGLVIYQGCPDLADTFIVDLCSASLQTTLTPTPTYTNTPTNTITQTLTNTKTPTNTVSPPFKLLFDLYKP
jgi:hypothetical protein